MTKFIERHKFIFDEVFDTDATNEDVSGISCACASIVMINPPHSHFMPYNRSIAEQHFHWSSICSRAARPPALRST